MNVSMHVAQSVCLCFRCFLTNGPSPCVPSVVQGGAFPAPEKGVPVSGVLEHISVSGF